MYKMYFALITYYGWYGMKSNQTKPNRLEILGLKYVKPEFGIK